jgi:hypothetical protein
MMAFLFTTLVIGLELGFVYCVRREIFSRRRTHFPLLC